MFGFLGKVDVSFCFEVDLFLSSDPGSDPAALPALDSLPLERLLDLPRPFLADLRGLLIVCCRPLTKFLSSSSTIYERRNSLVSYFFGGLLVSYCWIDFLMYLDMFSEV